MARTAGAEQPDGSSTRRRAPLLVALAAVGLVGLGVALVAPGGDPSPAAPETGLPVELVGLPAQRSGAAAQASVALVDRLAAEPSVRDVGVGSYAGSGRALVVLDVAPRTAFTDETAGELTASLLGAAAPAGAPVRSAASDDGRALLSCTAPEPGEVLCVSVEADRALVVLASGTPESTDPLDLAADVRDEVRSAETG